MRSWTPAAVLAGTLLTSAMSAWANPTVSSGVASPTAGAEAAPPPSGVAADPNIDRGFIQPTALTQPAGTLTYNNYELLLHGLTYGLTERLQVSVTALLIPPLPNGELFAGAAALKWRFLSTARVHLAVQGSASYMSISFVNSDSPSGSSGSDASVFAASAFASICLRKDCSSLLSANAGYGLGLTSGTTSPHHMLVYGASIVHPVGAHVKLLGEVTSLAPFDASDPEFRNTPAALVGYGIRLHGAKIASDIGFMKAISASRAVDFFVLGVPFVNFSYRWQ